MAEKIQTSNERVKRFRKQTTELGYSRFEVVADGVTIKRLRDVAKARGIPVYEALELGSKLLVNWHKANVTGNG